MHDPYLYEGTEVLRNKLGIRDKAELEKAEGDYTSFRLRSILDDPVLGDYDFKHFCRYHETIFQDVYDWAGIPRTIDIEKAERALGGWSIEYAKADTIQVECSEALGHMRDIQWDKLDIDGKAKAFSDSLARLWKVHSFREGNTRTTVTFVCQFYESKGYSIDRTLFEKNSTYVRDALVAYNAVFEDVGDMSRPEFLRNIVRDAIERGDKKNIKSAIKNAESKAQENQRMKGKTKEKREINRDI